MRKLSFIMLFAALTFFTSYQTHAQVKVGVFDIDLMVQAMPGYVQVDSLLGIYQRDSLVGEYQYFLGEYQRLDSVLRFVDTPGVKSGAVTATKMKFDNDQKQQVMGTIINWRDIAQQKYNNKRGFLSQNLYQQVATSYQKILLSKGYNIVLKPNTYEYGPRYDNIFISVARDLKLTSLPQELLVVGVDPDVPVTQPKPQVGAGNTNTKGGTKQ